MGKIKGQKNKKPYTKHRDYIICDLCNNPFTTIGMPGHKALAHNVREKKIFIKDPIEIIEGKLSYPEVSNQSENKEVVGKQLTTEKEQLSVPNDTKLPETKKPDKQPLYTEQDVKIFMARLAREDNAIDKRNAITNLASPVGDVMEDFERRFKISYYDLQMVYSDKLTFSGNYEQLKSFISNYADLTYSR
jgi:hypothetical protein